MCACVRVWRHGDDQDSDPTYSSRASAAAMATAAAPAAVATLRWPPWDAGAGAGSEAGAVAATPDACACSTKPASSSVQQHQDEIDTAEHQMQRPRCIHAAAPTAIRFAQMRQQRGCTAPQPSSRAAWHLACWTMLLDYVFGLSVWSMRVGYAC